MPGPVLLLNGPDEGVLLFQPLLSVMERIVARDSPRPSLNVEGYGNQ